ncbi:hypothetical protein ACJEDT_13160 [Rhodococcoides fascians]|uniref:hypothetical protein n=1 Tax=Rhodococcoides fascians TaxID=1828 RepID=UPI00389AE537
MARFPTLGPGDKVRDKHLPDRLKKDSLDGSYAPVSGDGSPAQTLTTATGRAIAFAVALG